MARPRRTNADFFGHDAHMRNNRKVKALRSKHGIEGYGVYIMFLESLTSSDHYRILIDDGELELIAGDFDVPSSRLKELIDYMIFLKLLQKDGQLIYSDDLLKILEPLFEKRRRDLDYRRRKTDDSADIDDENTQRKEENSKANKRKEEIDDVISSDDLLMYIVMDSSETSYVNKQELVNVINELRENGICDDEIFTFVKTKTPKTLTTKNLFLNDWHKEVQHAKTK
ncbi:MAG: Lin1244/Lin1753 domain-containing protein [Deferribacterales bacterium]